jgi:hypothetical protein
MSKIEYAAKMGLSVGASSSTTTPECVYIGDGGSVVNLPSGEILPIDTRLGPVRFVLSHGWHVYIVYDQRILVFNLKVHTWMRLQCVTIR